MVEVLHTDLGTRMRKLQDELNFISDLRLNMQTMYDINGRTYTFEAYDLEKKTVTMLVEYDDEALLQDYEENGGVYFKESFFLEYEKEAYINFFIREHTDTLK